MGNKLYQILWVDNLLLLNKGIETACKLDESFHWFLSIDENWFRSTDFPSEFSCI